MDSGPGSNNHFLKLSNIRRIRGAAYIKSSQKYVLH